MEAPRAIVPAPQMAFVQAGTGDATPGAAGWSRRVREDKRLFERYRRTGDREDRDELVARLLLLARLAWRYRDRDEYDDLVQVASCGLLKAIERYDPRVLHLRRAHDRRRVEALLRDRCWTVRVPRELHDRSIHVHRASQALMARLGRSPTAAEIAGELDTSVELVLETIQTASARCPDRLDAPPTRMTTTADIRPQRSR